MSSEYAIDERVRKVRRGNEIIEIVEELVESPKGEVIVEMHDGDTGKLVHREQSDNFIAPQWAITSRSWQRMAWDHWAFNINTGIDLTEWGNMCRGYQFPNHALACWLDDTTESPSTEHTLRTGEMGIVAWAGKFPTGSPTGARGAINVSTSTRSITGESCVYDWPTSAGNGTFRSVGYTTMVTDDGYGYSVQAIRPKPSERHYMYHTGTATSVMGASTYTGMGMPDLDLSGNLIIPIMDTSSRALGWISVPSSVWDQAWAFDATGAAEDDMSATVVTGKTLTGNAGSVCHFLGETTGYYWFSFLAAPSVQRFARMSTSTYAVDRITSLPDADNSSPFGCMIGTDLYIAGGNTGSNWNTVWRYDCSSATPSVTATISLNMPSWLSSASNQIDGIRSDGTDLYVKVTGATAGYYKFNTSGDRLSHLGAFFGGNTETGATPYGAAYAQPGLNIFESLYVQRSGVAVLSASGSNGSYYNTGINAGTSGYFFFANGALQGTSQGWVGSPTNRFAMGFAELGHNLGSRVLLGSNTTKSSSNTMKITYNVTLPDFIP